MSAAQFTTNQTQKTPPCTSVCKRTPAQIQHANLRSASRAKTLHWEGYEIEQVDTFTFHIIRPLHRVLAETTRSFLKGGNGSEVAAFYVIDASEIADGIVTCGCAGYEGWGDCCHAQLFKQAFLSQVCEIEVAKLDADARAFAAEAAKVVPVTVSHAAPLGAAHPVATPLDGVKTCKKKGCTAPVGTSSSCVANRYCAKCQRFADFGE